MEKEASGVRFGLVFTVIVLAVSVPFYTFGPGSMFPASWSVKIPATAFMTFVPVSIAVALSYAEGGWKAAGALFKGVLSFHRIRPAWYAAALLLIPAATVLSYVTLRAMGVALPGPTPITPTLLAVIPLFVFGVGEEVGWTAYLTPRLQARWGALPTAAFLAVICALWHVIPYADAGRSATWIAAQTVTILALRVIMIWLYNNTGRMVLPVILLHVMTNVSYHMFPREGSHYDPITTAVFEIAFALVISLLWGGKTIDRYRFARPTAP